MELKNHILKFNETEISIPYYHLVGKKPGNKLFITGGIHGDEVNGVYAVGEIVKWLEAEIDQAKLNGELYIFPILNPSAFAAGIRVTPEDGKDLNRQFGEDLGQIEATMSEAMANSLVESFFSKCNMGVDFHDAGNGALFLPHTRIHKNDADKCVSCSRELARYFGTEYILEREGDMKMMAVALNNKHNVPVITVEIGGAQQIYPEAGKIAISGVSNLLVANSMYPGKIDVPKKQYLIQRRIGARFSTGSVVELTVKLGDRVEKGEKVGERFLPVQARREDILAPDSGVIFSIWPYSLLPADRTFLSVVDVDCEHPEEKGIEVLEDLVVWEYNG